MFGAYQAGAWDFLSRNILPDMIVGASVGSLNGFLIASGHTGGELIERWRNVGDLADVRWRFPKRLHEGILDNTRLEGMIQDLCETYVPHLDFGVVLTECRTMRPRLFRWPEIEWTHIAGSCSVPLFLRHYQIDGSWYSDGGLLDPAPVWAAMEMGATQIISINLLKNRPWYLDAVISAVRACGGYAPQGSPNVSIMEISPSQRLGTAVDAMRWSRTNTERWIDLGRRDAEAALGRL